MTDKPAPVEVTPSAWQRRRKWQLDSDPPGSTPQWGTCTAKEATDMFERAPAYEYRPLYTAEALTAWNARTVQAELVEALAAKDRLMIAAAATVKATMEEYKRGHADGVKSGRAMALEEAARIAKAAQYSKSPATDTMRGIEKLITEPPLQPSHARPEPHHERV